MQAVHQTAYRKGLRTVCIVPHCTSGQLVTSSDIGTVIPLHYKLINLLIPNFGEPGKLPVGLLCRRRGNLMSGSTKPEVWQN